MTTHTNYFDDVTKHGPMSMCFRYMFHESDQSNFVMLLERRRTLNCFGVSVSRDKRGEFAFGRQIKRNILAGLILVNAGARCQA